MEKSRHIKRIKVDESIILKELEYSDAPDIFKAISGNRKYLSEWLPFVDYTYDQKDSENFIKSVLEVPDEDHEYVFVILYNNDFAGVVGFKATDAVNRKTEIGYWICESFQRKGIVTKSIKALIKFAFTELLLNRIQIKCAVGNQRSRNIPIKLGFFFEGIEREGERMSNGRYYDIEVYSFLKKQSL